MKRRTLINSLIGAMAAACLPVAWSRRDGADAAKLKDDAVAERSKPLVSLKNGSIYAVYLYDADGSKYTVETDYEGAVGTLIIHEHEGRWYACLARQRIADMVRFEVLPHSWA